MTDTKPAGALPLIVMLTIGGAVFAMHFGASCMLWPTTWGRDSGVDWLSSFGGFFLSGLILPYLGYVAVTRGGGPLFDLASKVGPRFAYFFGGFTVLIMGPLFVIPRMSAASWDALSRVLNIDAQASSWLMSCVFTIAYYGITYWFIYKETEIVDKLSKYLVPALVVLEIFLIGNTLIHPIGEPVARNFSQSPFSYGFISGYQTMDLPAALMYAGIILTDIRARGITLPADVIRNLIKAGGIGFVILGAIMFGEFYRGYTASGTFPDVSYAKLSASIILHQWGTVGGTVFNGALVFAAMTTAIGLTAGTGDFVHTASKKTISYKAACLGTLTLSTLISISGLDAIITWTAPILNLIYPPCIALVIFNVFFTKHVSMMRGACIFTLIWGVVEALNGYLGILGHKDALSFIFNLVPGARAGFGFLPFLIAGALFGALAFRNGPPFPVSPHQGNL